jgi:hypothetical protein
MMLVLAVALLLQARAPTVGDTIWVVRRVVASSAHAVRPADWQLTGDVELLGKPRVREADGVTEVAYPLVVWVAGTHTVSVPGPLLLAADGSVDSLPPTDTTLTVASVLPRNAADSSLHPQPQAGLVHRRTVEFLPLGILLAAALVLLAPLHWWWRRRGRPTAVAIDRRVAVPPLARWAAAGESRTVLAAAAATLRAAIAAVEPDAHEGLDTAALLGRLTTAPGMPRDEIAEVLESLDRARFAGAAPSDVLVLHERATALARSLGPVGAAP